ncbi:MAG TPA: YciI family protein [Xanthomonadaceae bacterium]|nr:YciI family protein [Xanthomonadaceae bacterium]
MRIPVLPAALLFLLPMACVTSGQVHAESPDESAREVAAPVLFAVEFRTGPNWDHERPAHEQSWFREHSANLRRLRENGSLILGARYADKGLVVLSAISEDEAHAMVRRDPSVEHGVFRYELHRFMVFYPGTVGAMPERG